LFFLHAISCFYIKSGEWNKDINSSFLHGFEITSHNQKPKSKEQNEFPTEFSIKLKELNKSFTFNILSRPYENSIKNSNIFLIDKHTNSPIKYKYFGNDFEDPNEVYFS